MSEYYSYYTCLVVIQVTALCLLVGVDITSSIPMSHHSQRPSLYQIAHGVICRSHSYYQQYNNTRLILLLLLQDTSWPVGFHGIAIFAAGLSVIRGVATTETSE